MAWLFKIASYEVEVVHVQAFWEMPQLKRERENNNDAEMLYQ